MSSIVFDRRGRNMHCTGFVLISESNLCQKSAFIAQTGPFNVKKTRSKQNSMELLFYRILTLEDPKTVLKLVRWAKMDMMCNSVVTNFTKMVKIKKSNLFDYFV